ncbi:aromatic ring-hydroxylating oxygenase subunit alpha [Kiloniella antarctica]|uniref:Aromatic ring-hydroxylating dioxygenase subunit alpha n=1 Tax=Kiloniella antarctica TaxID=1550907 RepID=A0ABW5BLJ8_9PROT
MEQNFLISQESLRAVLKPIEQAHGMPNASYADKDFFPIERDNVLGKTWACIGFASDIPSKGYAKPIDFMGLPLVVLRNRKDELNVYHNVCSHRGRKLVQEETKVQGMIRCPYHSWTYDLNGGLRGTPHIGGVGVHTAEGFSCEGNGLREIRSEVWMDMVFINLSGDALSFEEHIAPLEQRWKPFWGESGLTEIRRSNSESGLEIEVNCNWKLAVENYCESYHLPFVHPALNTYSRLEDHYNIEQDNRFAGQGSLAYNLAETTGTKLPTFTEWPDDKLKHAEYIAVYPNVLLGIQADHAFAMLLEPIAHDKTIEHLRVYFVGDDATDDACAISRTAILESWRVVFDEDIAAVEGMQQGRSSPAFQGGVFSPVMDGPTHHFNRWVAQSLHDAQSG